MGDLNSSGGFKIGKSFIVAVLHWSILPERNGLGHMDQDVVISSVDALETSSKELCVPMLIMTVELAETSLSF